MLNKKTIELINEINIARNTSIIPFKDETFKVSSVASSLASVYETVRNAVEFSADHLVRQAAINRILKRRIFLNEKSVRIASLLIKELLWGKYFKEKSISLTKEKEIAKIIDKYYFALNQETEINNHYFKVSEFRDWLLSTASCEIEECLFYNPLPQAVINYCFESLSEVLDFNESNTVTKRLQIYIAVERSFALNNKTFLSYKLLKIFYSEWFKKDKSHDINMFKGLIDTYVFIQKQLNYPLKDDIKRHISKLIPPFNLIRDIIYKYPDEFENILKNKEELESIAGDILEDKYDSTQQKLNRASKRSIIYIFLTKMIIGLLLELPFDMFLGRPNFLALGINAVFPPLLIFLLNINVKVPGDENTQKLLSKIEDYFYKDSYQKIIIDEKRYKRKLERIFNLFYLVTYILIFGGIIIGLHALGFNPVSIIIFIFFSCVVSFFAFRIRDIAKYYLAQGEEGEDITSSMMDIIFLPIIKVGQWLSFQISKFNILSFILDFIIEAPLKVFLEIIEEWIHFIRVKKEEIVT